MLVLSLSEFFDVDNSFCSVGLTTIAGIYFCSETLSVTTFLSVIDKSFLFGGGN
ncbi:hypothetical protein [Arsenophonus endosymbiont of Aphis craccivora]|uniref:hypothetical protein n=1 Tax=Arsenophonus endosymbiont of Aphis craccivora TaxID=1231049 RepID=UPI0015DFA228|nr:hypothetical protein [Arsenophonus endosymbiont of Aphis craccivora]